MGNTRKYDKLNDKGMTLVEVLVAMIIISVIGVAFLQSFSYAVRTNRLAKQKQEALSIAQTMMEVAKAYSVAEMDAGLDSLVFNSGSYTVNSSGHYTITGVNGTGYDVTMDLTPSTSGGVNNQAAYNMEQVQNPNSTTDALFVQPINDEMYAIQEQAYNLIIADTSVDDKVKNYLINGLSDPSLMAMKYFQITQRNVVIDVKDEGGNVTVIPSVSYTFEITDYEYKHVNDDGSESDETFSYGPATFTISYSDCFSGSGSLRSVYAFYYPLYQSLNSITANEWIGCDADAITINSTLTDNISVYLIKQKLPASDPAKQNDLNTKLRSIEAYKPTVGKNVTSPIDLYHNLARPLYSDSNALVDCILSGGFVDDGSRVYTELTRQVASQQLLYQVEIHVSNGGANLLTLNGTTNAR